MGAVTTSLREQAKTIFADLGYRVSTDGGELRAERKWRTVHVTPVHEIDAPPETGEFRCFVTKTDRIEALERELGRHDPAYEWAIIGVDDEDYEVARRTTGA
jgi:hypothetical protein